MSRTDSLVIAAPWDSLRRFTDARIALGRAGHSLPTIPHLNFQLAHAQARDAVRLPLDVQGVAAALSGLGLTTLELHSAAADRDIYLQRPDLGRTLDESSRQTLKNRKNQQPLPESFDLAFVVADGLSALAIHQNVEPLLAAVLARLRADTAKTWTIAPVALVVQGRVAVGDEVGHALRARVVVLLIGERPGLSSPDSLGVYLSWEPRAGLNDAQRNCISNVRPAGLAIEAAAAKLHYLLSRSFALQLSGIGLKDDDDPSLAEIGTNATQAAHSEQIRAIWHVDETSVR